jgi:hypothetical protein
MGLADAGGLKQATSREIAASFLEALASRAPLEIRQDVTASGNTVVDLSAGFYIRLTLAADSSLVFANWLPEPVVNRVTLEINGSVYAVDLSSFGIAAPVCSGVFEIVSTDAGKTSVGRKL